MLQPVYIYLLQEEKIVYDCEFSVVVKPHRGIHGHYGDDHVHPP